MTMWNIRFYATGCLVACPVLVKWSPNRQMGILMNAEMICREIYSKLLEPMEKTRDLSWVLVMDR